MILFIIGFFVIGLVGTLSHFTYDISNHNKIVGIFSAVNESTWEHIKIALTGFFIWSIIDGFFYGHMANYFLAKLIGSLSIIIIIPVLFYGYKLLLKKDVFQLDILIFYIAIFVAQFISFKILFGVEVPYAVSYFSFLGIIAILIWYLLTTIYPIKNELYLDPITNKHGYNGHYHVGKKVK